MSPFSKTMISASISAIRFSSHCFLFFYESMSWTVLRAPTYSEWSSFQLALRPLRSS